MSNNEKNEADWSTLQSRIIGLGENSIRKNHYPELKARIRELERVRTLLSLSQDLFFVLDVSTLNIVDWNMSAREHLGYNFPPHFSDIDEGKAARVIRCILKNSEESCKCQQSRRLVSNFIRKDGSLLPVEMTISFETTSSRESSYAIIVARDITERLEAEKSLKLSAAVFETTVDMIIIMDANRNIHTANPSTASIMGYASEEMIGMPISTFRSSRQGAGCYERIWETVKNSGYWQGEVWGRKADGTDNPFLGSVSRLLDEDGNIQHYIYVLADISKIKKAEEQLIHVSNHNTLTQLPNRVMMMSVLDHALHRARQTKTYLTLLLLNIDRFKSINDTLGHNAGDHLLRAVAERIVVSTPTASLVAHTAGDEFAILLENTPSPETAELVAKNVLDAFKDPVHLDGFEVFVSLSIGMCSHPGHGQSASEISRNCDAAMHQAKSNGGNQTRTYTPELTKVAFQNLQIETSLRQAIEGRELELFYQPQFDLNDNTLCGAEALVRWRHPTRGIVGPNVFIPRAEETGLIIPMGEQLLRQACNQIQDWLSQGLPAVPISVNVSGIQFNNSAFEDTIQNVLLQTGVDPQYLKLEITESFAMSEGRGATDKLHKIRNLGVELAIDDFGTGYSSLAYLRDLPVTYLKIDREFIKNLPDHQGDAAITKAIIAMGQSIGLKVVAEGVETQIQQQFLHSLGCDIMQGYYKGRPVPADEFQALHLMTIEDKAEG